MEVSDAAEPYEFRDYRLLNLVVSPDKESAGFQVKQKLYEKLETNLEPIFKSTGVTTFGIILFYKGKILDKSECIAQVDNITDEDTIYATESLGKSFIFKRFKELYLRWLWSSSAYSSDDLIFVPTWDIKVCRFT